jgi:hypothetical protein
MFGYVTANYQALSKEEQEQYRQYYCGLCRSLERRYGNVSRLTLNNDMTFLMILLSSLYEPGEDVKTGRCLTHPLKRRAYRSSEVCDYCADMTILLSYLKCMDDRMDDGSLRSRAGAASLQKPYEKVRALYPEKVETIRGCVDQINALEAQGCREIDGPLNLSAQILGEVFAFRRDAWEDDLRALGAALGRFIYLMDAYDDLQADIRKGRFNALQNYQKQEDFESFCEESLLMMIGECTAVFETLPLEKHLSILRNVLYSGVWMRYLKKTGKPCAKSEDEETEHEHKPV